MKLEHWNGGQTLTVTSGVGERGLVGGAPMCMSIHFENDGKRYEFKCEVTCTDAEVWPLRKAIQDALERDIVTIVKAKNEVSS